MLEDDTAGDEPPPYGCVLPFATFPITNHHICEANTSSILDGLHHVSDFIRLVGFHCVELQRHTSTALRFVPRCA